MVINITREEIVSSAVWVQLHRQQVFQKLNIVLEFSRFGRLLFFQFKNSPL
ncbi:Uncharacterised protein [Yersinia enterocolitica]|nr:hypothetical protein CH47_2566 [Yersinia enterocolitica]VTP89961.1 Uncharacterised protein [Yersinia enterocolitica subsp. enterocolitica]AJJ23961.1 hypothetical protein CH49_2641 [Yersinia enterocolitica]KGA73170.1 hypothetical protein DJ59_4038 [Yersinia enterocolitica]CNG04853.1 Uncharacterised protein [Yersinia enterocolitica]